MINEDTHSFKQTNKSKNEVNLARKTIEDANKELHIVVGEPEDQVLGLDLQHLMDITTSGLQNALSVRTSRFAHNFNADGSRINDRQRCLLF